MTIKIKQRKYKILFLVYFTYYLNGEKQTLGMWPVDFKVTKRNKSGVTWRKNSRVKYKENKTKSGVTYFSLQRQWDNKVYYIPSIKQLWE